MLSGDLLFEGESVKMRHEEDQEEGTDTGNSRILVVLDRQTARPDPKMF